MYGCVNHELFFCLCFFVQCLPVVFCFDDILLWLMGGWSVFVDFDWIDCSQTKGLFISSLFYNWSPARRAIVIGIAVGFRIAWRVFVLCDSVASNPVTWFPDIYAGFVQRYMGNSRLPCCCIVFRCIMPSMGVHWVSLFLWFLCFGLRAGRGGPRCPSKDVGSRLFSCSITGPLRV